MLVLKELDDQSRILYGSLERLGDVYDANLRLVLSPTDLYSAAETPDAERIENHARDGFVVPLFDDGRTYGVVVTWEQAP